MKHILLTICLFLYTILSFAQKSESKLSISIKSGVTFANMYGPDVANETFLNGYNSETFYANHPASNGIKNGFNSILLLNYKLSKSLSLGLGASYIQKGAKINANKHWNTILQTYENVNGKIYWNQNFWTIEIPLTVYFPIKQNDIFLQAGIFMGYLIDTEEKGDISISNIKYEYINNRRANEKEPGFSLTCGYLYSLPNNNGDIIVELSWTRSFINSPGRDMIPDPQYYFNQTISLNIGYKFNINFKNSKQN